MFLFFLLFFFKYNDAKFYNETNLATCKVYYSRYGSTYKDLFEINKKTSNGSLLDFHFSVIAASDAHILLAPSKDLNKELPVYEIVIGAGGNTFSDIRRKQKSAVKASKIKKNLLSALDAQSFWIHINSEGVIEVGKEGEQLAFLSWIDPDPLPINVFSFSTWEGIDAKWFFDCLHEINARKLEEKLTPHQQLRKRLLFSYDQYVRPVQFFNNITVIHIELETKFVIFDDGQLSINYNGAVTLSWQDEKMKWNITEHNGINILHLHRREIWVPSLYLFNAVFDGSDILEDTTLVVNSNGFVNWSTTINLVSWCNSYNFSSWPQDVHNCQIILGFVKEYENMQLIFNENQSKLGTPFFSTWKLEEILYTSNKGWQNDTLPRNVNNLDPPALIIEFIIKRVSTISNLLLFSPFYAITTCLLIGFLISPLSKIKIGIICFQLMLSTIMLIGLGIIIPIHSQSMPNLLQLYSYCFTGGVIGIIIEVIVINLVRIEHKTTFPRILEHILQISALKVMLCLTEIKKINQRYGCLYNGNGRTSDLQSKWIFLSQVIDRISFFVYLSLVIYALCLHY